MQKYIIVKTKNNRNIKRMNMNKNELRKIYLSKRKNIENKEEKSLIINNKIKKMSEYKNAKIIAIYKSLPSEVNTTSLINDSIKLGKDVVLPKVEKEELKFYKITSLEDSFIKSNFGVEEPLGEENNYIDKNDIDLVIVPGICFDKEKNRLGFGKGYYDRYLQNVNINTIGICFEEQIVENRIPITEYDVKIKKIITDKKIYN